MLSFAANAAEVHVRPEGPIRTLAEAQREARKAKATVIVHAGTYYLPETLVFGSEDSGTEYRAAPGEMVVISGGLRLDLQWSPLKDGIMQAKTPPLKLRVAEFPRIRVVREGGVPAHTARILGNSATFGRNAQA